MGFRFRRSVRVIPGIRFNFSRTRTSASVARPGATVSLGKRGVRTTVGLPGIGLSYRERMPWHRRAVRRADQLAANPTPVRRGLPVVGWFILLGFVGVVLALLGR